LAQERTRPFDRSVLGKVWYALGLQPGTPKAAANPFCWSLFDTYGAYPSGDDRHTVEFFAERFPQWQYYGVTLGVDAFTFEGFVDSGDRKFADMRARALAEKPLDMEIFVHSEGEGEKPLDILRSMEYDTRGVVSVNLPNTGSVPNLPADAIVEPPAVAMASGLRPVQILDLPGPVAVLRTRRLTAGCSQRRRR
jgi:alpha-galactosidase